MSLRKAGPLACALLAPVAALAQTASAQTAPKPAATSKPIAPGVTVETRLRFEGRDNATFSKSGPDPREIGGRLRVGYTWKGDKGLSALIQGQYAYDRITSPSSLKRTTDDLDIFQAYVDAPAAGAKFRLGRQMLSYGDQRLVGTGDWSMRARSWDAGRATIAGGITSTDVFVAKLAVAANKLYQPVLAGAYSTIRIAPDRTADVYLLHKSARTSPTATQKVTTFGVRPRITFKKGSDATLEAAYQTGRSGGRDLRAWAYAAVVGHTFPGPQGLRLALERDAASGGNPTGTGTVHTFDQLYPTNHGFYGIADLVGWRNMEAWRLSLRGKPAPQWTATLDGHRFFLRDSRDFWYGDAGRPVTGVGGKVLRDATGAAGRNLGSEIDATVQYALQPSATLSGGYARFLPGSFVRRTNGVADATDWFYIQGNYTF